MALGIEQRLADHALDRRDARHDDPAPAQLIKQQPRQCRAVGRRQRGRQEPRLKLGPDRPGEGLEAEHIAQRIELLVAGRTTRRIVSQCFRRDAELLADEGERHMRDDLARPEQPPRITQPA